MEDEIPFLVFAKRRAIHRINLELNGTDFDTISRFPVNAVAIDFNVRYIIYNHGNVIELITAKVIINQNVSVTGTFIS